MGRESPALDAATQKIRNNRSFLSPSIDKCNIFWYTQSMKTTQTPKTAPRKWQGQKWIRNEKRLAIYLRDGLSCVWCGAAVEDGVQLTLDHLIPHSAGGKNEATNLITGCKRCNSSRGDRSVEAFATAVAAYLNHGVTPDMILAHISQTIARPLDISAAKELIARRGTFSAALKD